MKDKGLVKGINFKNHTYLGDPINAVRIFNAKEADELFFFDTIATLENRHIPFELVSKLSNECFMPFAVGGGIRSIDTIKKLINIGSEKIAINSYAVEDPYFIKEASQNFGSQAIVVSIDVKQEKDGSYFVVTHSGTKKTNTDPVTHAKKAEEMGAGEILINSIDKDGTMSGYDLKLVKLISMSVNIPVIASGGAGDLDDFADVFNKSNASAAAAGSFFVFHGRRRAVLISYPTKQELESLRR